MSKEKSPVKETKKKPLHSLKEKRDAKRDKKRNAGPLGQEHSKKIA